MKFDTKSILAGLGIGAASLYGITAVTVSGQSIERISLDRFAVNQSTRIEYSISDLKIKLNSLKEEVKMRKSVCDAQLKSSNEQIKEIDTLLKRVPSM
jgi:hypothetical protein